MRRRFTTEGGRDRVFRYRKGATFPEHPGVIVWDVHFDGWYIGQIIRHPYGLHGHTWRPVFPGGQGGWPATRRIDAATELFNCREAWVKGPAPTGCINVDATEPAEPDEHVYGLDCVPPAVIETVWVCPTCGASFREKLP